MKEEQAAAVAEILGGEAWQSGGGIWLVLKRRSDGRLVLVSDESVCEYEDEQSFERNEVWNSILLV